jgi:hypothetical protein
MASGADRLTMEDPIACEIHVQGALSPHWADRLGELRITRLDRPAAGDDATTVLRGELRDQAALRGVLTALYDRRLPLLAVRCAPATRPPRGGAATATADTGR